MLGRLSGGMFLFAAVEGFSHTRDRRKYFLRIYLMGAAMGALNLILMLFLRRPDGFYPQNNILATLTVLMVFWQGFDDLRGRKYLRGAMLIAIPAALFVIVPRLPKRWMPGAFILESTFLPLPMMTEGGRARTALRARDVSVSGAPQIAGGRMGRRSCWAGTCSSGLPTGCPSARSGSSTTTSGWAFSPRSRCSFTTASAGAA